MIRVKQLFIHPFKGLTPQKCDRVELRSQHGIPGDRAFALMFDDGDKYPELTAVPWMKKQHFAMQNDWSGLAALDCSYEPETGILTVRRKEEELLVADTHSLTGRDRIGSFFTGYLAGIYPSQTARHPNRTSIKVVGDFGKTRYPDREAVHISLVSQTTIEHLSELAGRSIDVRRFRPNIVLDGVPAWGEFDWVGKEMELGTARIVVTDRINRCLNIEVNPETGERDTALLPLLKKNFQHTQTGVLARVVTSGSVAVGEILK
ncbi:MULTISPECIES: MOSC domain-containing protein [Nostocales]|uniref:MOSC domain-containing protein n=3 Tax=Nostocales TaxID=1161 RepID=A0A0C1RAQ4_9CYAN|nr:MOSC domain-containing protein [Tolypothrix bouteillei]KAF3888360.1 MOSC domain-containing protein [Tolypothrix bouteillei VB521301]